MTIKRHDQLSSPNTFDVVIAGAGPAGSAIALELARAKLRILLIERSEFDQPRLGESLAPDVQSVMTRLALWQSFLDLNPRPAYGTRSVWGDPHPGDYSHLISVFGNGWHVDRLAVDQMMATAAQNAGATLWKSAKVTGLLPDQNNGFFVQVMGQEGSKEVFTRFLVDATGCQPALSSRLGARRIVFDRLVAVAARLGEDAENRHYTLVESVPEGWWYTAPVSDSSSMVMLMTDGDIAVMNQVEQKQNWLKAMERTTELAPSFAGKEMLWGPKTFSAVSQRMVRDSADHRPWLAAGDACLSVDPVSGSGMIRALRTAAAAVKTIMWHLEGDDKAISRYESDRDEECNQYLLELGDYYNMEQRWKDETFWKRRLVGLNQFREMDAAGLTQIG